MLALWVVAGTLHSTFDHSNAADAQRHIDAVQAGCLSAPGWAAALRRKGEVCRELPMDSNKEAGSGPSFWIPSGAVILSLLFSTWALQHEPFVNARPASFPSMVQTQVDARLWQDPFDALERYRELNKSDNKALSSDQCPGKPVYLGDSAIHHPKLENEGKFPEIMVALVPGSNYADEVELRRRIRYAVLAGLKSSHLVPDDESHISCWKPALSPSGPLLPFESFSADPFDPPVNSEGVTTENPQTYLFWLKEEELGNNPLARLDELRYLLSLYLEEHLQYSQWPPAQAPDPRVLKVIGPASSDVLRKMYREENELRPTEQGVPQQVEIYSPLATAEWTMLTRSNPTLTDGVKLKHPKTMQLLRTVSDDGTMAALLLDELMLRHVDPALGIRCARAPGVRPESGCPTSRWKRSNRVAIVAEWDSFYSRALIESFMSQVAERARPYPLSRNEKGDKPLMTPTERREAGQWMLSFGYLRGVDGRLPDKNAAPAKPPATDDKQSAQKAAPETADGNGQLDYLRRLADHIASVDEAQRNAGEDGIGAIGIFGQDTYDKLLTLQALKSRMPTKVYFSTDLDARMLQQGQAAITRNLVLAAPYGLTLTRALQQDVPPFRESLQSSVYIAVMAALAPQPLATKRQMFDYARSSLLAPSIYEIGKSGFIPLASKLTDRQSKECSVGSVANKGDQLRAQDITALRCLQDPSPPAYLQASPKMPEWLGQAQSFFWAGALCIVLIVLSLVLGWFHTDRSPEERRRNWVRRFPLLLHGAAALSAWAATLYWRVELLWLAGALVVLGMIGSHLNRRQLRTKPAERKKNADQEAGDNEGRGVSWYVVVPTIVFILLLLKGYQDRVEMTDNGLGEPMFLFEGISSWPTVALRLLAAIISLAALAWAWRKLNGNRRDIEAFYGLQPYTCVWLSKQRELWLGWSRSLPGKRRPGWSALGNALYGILLPFSRGENFDEKSHLSVKLTRARYLDRYKELAGGREPKWMVLFWIEHRFAGSFVARLIRVLLMTWLFLVVTSVIYVLVPIEDLPVRGNAEGIWLWSWILPTVCFQLLVFWVIDANLLLRRFIRQLSQDYLIWPRTVRKQWEKLPIPAAHICLDDYLDLSLIAKRTSAVNRLIYAPTLVMLVLMASRSTLFDNWPAPVASTIILLINAAMLLASAFLLRRSAEAARRTALERVDRLLLEGIDTRQGEAVRMKNVQAKMPAEEAQLIQVQAAAERETFIMLRDRMKALKTGAFSPYSEDPLLRAVLVSLTGLGSTVVIDALNFFNF